MIKPISIQSTVIFLLAVRFRVVVSNALVLALLVCSEVRLLSILVSVGCKVRNTNRNQSVDQRALHLNAIGSPCAIDAM